MVRGQRLDHRPDRRALLALRYTRLVGDGTPLSWRDYQETPAWVVDGVLLVRKTDHEMLEQERRQADARREAERLAREG